MSLEPIDRLKHRRKLTEQENPNNNGVLSKHLSRVNLEN